ncbi:MAG: PAS domain S-box protein [bacterium]
MAKEESLRKLESRVISIIDNTLVGVFQSNVMGEVLFMNKPLLKMLEYESSEDINKHGGARILYKNPNERDKIVSLLNEKHYIEDYELEFVSKTGKRIFVYLCMRLEDNILSGTIVDITRLKVLENQLRKAKNYSEMLLTFTPSAIFTVDLNQRITRWNNRAKEITGYSAEEVIGKKCTLFMNSPCKDKCGLYSANVKKPVICRECTLTRKDGQIRIVLKSADFLIDENGNIIGGIESLDDITERKKAEEQFLILSKFPFENPNPVLRINEKGEILYKNPATLKLLKKTGLSEKEIFKILPENIVRLINQALRNRTTIGDLEVIIGNKVYSYTLTPIPEQKYVNLYGSDITERKKIELMKESAFREVSHELKTPIAMIEMAQDINQQAIKNKDINQIVKTQSIISNNLKRLSKDVNNILAMFVLKRKKVLNKIHFSVKKLVEEIVQNIQYLLYEKKLKVKMEIPENLENIFADPQEIKILLNNIIDNAVKFSEKGSITISMRLRRGFVRIMVKDTGIGISPDVKENIFTRFYKRHPAVPGTGLGLTISKEIIEMHNGSIKVFSKGIGKGTIVAVYLPVV